MLPRSRMMLVLAPASLLTLVGTVLSALVLRRSAGPAELLLVLCLLVGYARTALSACGAFLGVLPTPPSHAPDPPDPAQNRTALLMPIYNEDPRLIAAAVATMAASLTQADGVTIFVLSDTQDASVAAREATLFPPVDVTASGVVVRYRRRAINTGRKAGNLAEFCAGWGRDFDQAIVLDADSLMTGHAIRALQHALHACPGAGLVQSVSYPIGAGTLFGRIQQFAARLATPLNVAGQHRWQGPRGTYWGHNAILRLEPFRRHATLPVLPGRPPMGGEVLCHDTIEAALLLRAGWAVELAPEITGSYETTPSNLLDHLARERRWCQGNLQHLRLLATRGFLPESRLHVLTGILHYLASPAGLGLTALLLLARGDAPALPAVLVAALGWLTLLLLFSPKWLSLVRALASRDAAARFGGRPRLLAGAIVEQLSSVLTAPILTVSVTGFVLATAFGRVVAWDPPARGDRAVGWREAWTRLRWHTALGIGLGVLAAGFRPDAWPWFALFLLPLAASVPIAVCSGSVGLGGLARRAGLFATEDELTPSAALTASQARTVPDAASVQAAE